MFFFLVLHVAQAGARPAEEARIERDPDDERRSTIYKLGYTDLNSALSINYIVINVYVCMFCFLICITSCLIWMWVVVVVFVVVVALVASIWPHSLASPLRRRRCGCG